MSVIEPNWQTHKGFLSQTMYDSDKDIVVNRLDHNGEIPEQMMRLASHSVCYILRTGINMLDSTAQGKCQPNREFAEELSESEAGT